MICVSYECDAHITILVMASNAYHSNFCNVPLTCIVFFYKSHFVLNSKLFITIVLHYFWASVYMSNVKKLPKICLQCILTRSSTKMGWHCRVRSYFGCTIGFAYATNKRGCSRMSSPSSTTLIPNTTIWRSAAWEYFVMHYMSSQLASNEWMEQWEHGRPSQVWDFHCF